MIASDYKDCDGFKLQFEESVSESERKFYMQTFPRVDDVANNRIHCSTCDVHVRLIIKQKYLYFKNAN